MDSKRAHNRPHSSQAAAIHGLVQRFVARQRLQRAILGAIEGACLGLMGAAVGLAATRTGFADPDSWWIWAALTALLTLGGALFRARPSIDAIAAAQAIDRAHGLHDRLSTAISLAEDKELTRQDPDFVEAQLRDALRFIDQVDPARAAPWKTPTDTRLLTALVTAVILIGLFPITDHEQPLPPSFRATFAPVLDDATLAMERDRLRDLQRRVDQLPDEQAQALLDEIQALLDAVENREISDRQFLEAIDDLIDRYFPNDILADELTRLEDALAKAAAQMREEHAEELAEHPELQQALEALEDGDLQRASEALADLAQRLDEENLSPEEAQRLAEMLESFAEQIDRYEDHLQELFQQHRDTFEQLAEQFQDRDDLSDREQDLLDDARQRMEDAERERDEFNQSTSRRQLEQLSRELEESAEELRRDQGSGGEEDPDRQDGGGGDSEEGERPDTVDGVIGEGEDSEVRPGDDSHERGSQGRGEEDSDRPNYQNEVGRKMDDASRQLEEMEQQRQQQQQREQIRGQLEEMRESMSRSQPGEEGQQEGDRRRGEQMEDFMNRARGEESDSDGPPQQSQTGEDPGGQDHDQGEGGDGEFETGQGEGAGRGGPEDDGDQGFVEPDEGGFDHVREEVAAEQSAEGRSRSEIIRSASEEGFATVDYQDVFVDYEDIAEEVMEREAVPDGYRYYIKRYFQLIRPHQ